MLRFGLLPLALLACAPGPLVVEAGMDKPLLIGGPGDQVAPGADASEPGTSGATTPGTEPASASDDDIEPPTPGVFYPDRIDVEPPVEEEEEELPVPVLTVEQDRLSYYSIVGLALDRDGDNGFFGMSGGNSCEFDPQGGGLMADMDLFGCLDEPTVYDDQGRVMMTCPSDEVAFYSAAWGTQRYVVPGLIASDVNLDAFITIEDDGVCQLSRRGHDGSVASIEIPEVLCDAAPAIAVDETGDLIYLANGDLYVVDAAEWRQIGVGTGDLVAFEPFNGTVVTALEGDVRVLGLDRLGAPLWRMEASGPIQALASVGDKGAVFALEEPDPSNPDFVAYDGLTGAVWGVADAWSGMFDFAVSADGTTMIAAVGGTVYTYSIFVD
ncbi:MAG: hypothetical protein ACI9K2_005436 [Myxococcota bacterium]|jgi:hypothetical protein